MKYLKSFNFSLIQLRQDAKLSQEDVARLCSVDESVVVAWEVLDESVRCYPTIDNLLDLCLRVNKSLDFFLDFQQPLNECQLSLPGFSLDDESDLGRPLDVLNKELDKLIPSSEEVELLKRFRNSDPESRELIIQLMNA